MKRTISWLICFFCALDIAAQDHKFEAKLEAVKEKGYYKIVLSPELIGKLKLNYNAVRIYDEKGVEQVYFRKLEQAISKKALFKEYEIIEQLKLDSTSHLIFHNPEKKEINNVSFVVKNTAVRKRARLSGSNDKQNWYVIKDDYLLHSMQSEKETTELKILNFPLSDYEYFRLELDDDSSLPINILTVGYYDNQVIRGISTVFDCPLGKQKDSLNRSEFKIEFPEVMYLEKLIFNASGADYYSRTVNISIKNEYLTKKKKKKYVFKRLASFNLNSNSNNEVSLDGIAAKDLYIEIMNHDDKALKIEKVTASFMNKYLVAELSPEKSYSLKFGDKASGTPKYDIESFKSKIKPLPTKVKHQQIELIAAEEEKVKRHSAFESPYFIWTVIGLVGLILGFISFKMIKEIDRK